VTGLALFIDADDTLWENNVFFEEAFSYFVEILSHSSLSPEQVRASLDEIEQVNNKIHGYGAANFVRNLRECFHRLSERGVSDADLHRIAQIEYDLLNHPIQLIDGVEDTLAWLRSRHRLILCTKGNTAEQRSKIERSGLAALFHEIEIVREKDEPQYRALLASRTLAGPESWMVGNSPKSDVNPSLAAGMGAVYVPHPNTWRLERENVPENHERLLQLARFILLRDHF
jgi:putative hydrolase of the HAD superfamily